MNMKRMMGILMACGLALSVTACDKKEGTTTETKTTTPTTATETKTETETAPAADTAAKPAEGTEAAPAAGDTVAAAGDIGVAECDEYIQKMSECSTKMAPEAAGPMKESMETMKKAWKDAASTPEGKTALASGCKQALDAAKSAYASMGCQF
jgi:hypothetical protein